MAHTHKHDHTDVHPLKYRKAFAIGIGLNILFVIVEVIYGFLANSSALLADAGHNISDILGLAFAWAAAWMSTLKPGGKYTYGLRKTTILVSLLNALLLFGAVAIIARDAIHKLIEPEPVGGTQVMIVAAIGVVINTFTALLFIRGQKEDINVKGAFLHMAADAGVSLGVVVSGLLINITGILWIDPITSFIIILVILWGTWGLFIDAINLALDAVPKHIDIEQIKNYLLNREGVKNIHDLHVWALSTTQVALTVHVVTDEQKNDEFIQELQKELKNKFGISHTTIQLERNIIETEYDSKC
ncbi:MAG: cation diffusion facilitator family transporter [Bacteroidales bacterium]